MKHRPAFPVSLCAAALVLSSVAHAQALTPTQAPRAAVSISDSELLFREALRRGYVMDDLIVRRELQRRMLAALLQEHPQPEPDDAALAAFQAAHAGDYRAPPRYSFDQVYLSRGVHGARLQTDADVIKQRLHDHPDDLATLGDPFPRGNHFQALNPVQIEAVFGLALAQAVSGLPEGSWQGPLTSPLGLHFVRVTAVTPTRELTLAEARPRLRVDYQEAQKSRVLRAELARLRKKYAGAAPLPKPLATDEDIP
ncbi:MAG: peptidyl-prolyl cis-trans isomerase [Stenotrophobium sp.]